MNLLKAQLASEKQGHRIMDAAYWAAKEQLDDQTAALGALAEALGHTANAYSLFRHIGDADYWKNCSTNPCYEAAQALAPDAVQQAVEAWRAKDAEIEQLKANYDALVLEGTDRDDPTSMVSMIEAAEAKLAVAMGLLKDSTEAMAEWRKYRERPGLPSFNRQEANMWAAQQKADDFLADPSQATEGYRWAMQVVERIQNQTLWQMHIGNVFGRLQPGQDWTEPLRKSLLKDVAQEEKP